MYLFSWMYVQRINSNFLAKIQMYTVNEKAEIPRLYKLQRGNIPAVIRVPSHLSTQLSKIL